MFALCLQGTLHLYVEVDTVVGSIKYPRIVNIAEGSWLSLYAHHALIVTDKLLLMMAYHLQVETAPMFD